MITLIAAIRHNPSYQIFTAQRHAYAYEQARELDLTDRNNFTEGFYDVKTHTFYTRQQAGKLIIGAECHLYSEDLELLKGKKPK